MKTITYLKAILITVLLAAIWAVSCASLFEMQTFTTEIVVGNQTYFVESKALVFSEEVFGDLPISSILSTIIGAAASILAIVFAISSLIISNISERYSPHILKVYEEEAPTKRTLLSFVLITAFSMILLFLYQLIPSAISFMLLVSAITGFVTALVFLIDYFFYMFRILNPLRFSDVLKNKTLQFVERQNEKEVQDYIMSLGDVAARAFERKEVRISTQYLRILYDVFEGYIALKAQEPEKYKLVEGFSSAEKRNCVLLYILDEYFRIFRYSVLGKEEIISKEIVRNLFAILYESLFAKENDDVVIRIIETRSIFGAKCYPFYRIAIENRDPSRFLLIQNLVDILALNLTKEEKMKDHYLEEFISSHIFRINQLMIDNDDFDLFRREINNFSLMLPLSPPDQMQNNIATSLFLDVPVILYRDKDFMEEFNKRRAQIDYLVKHESATNFKTARILDKNLEGYKSFLIGNLEKLKDTSYSKLTPHKGELDQFQKLGIEPQNYSKRISDDIEDMKRRSYGLYVTSQICKVFFLIGAYLLFREKEEGIDAVKYIKELWSHTSPDDADSISLNRPPITSDPLWLTYLLLYGGERNSFWLSLRTFGDFHGVTKYTNRYYLLAIEKTKANLKVPSVTELEKLKRNSLTAELVHWYWFSYYFSSRPFGQSLLACCDSLIEEATSFDRLLSTKSKDEKGELRVIGAQEKLENTKHWFEIKTEEFKKTKQEIIKLLPLDPIRIEKCKAGISEAYNKASRLHEVGRIEEFSQERDKDLKFVQIYKRPLLPKDCLTEPSSVDCSTIWSDLGRGIGFRETKFFIKEILGHKTIEKIRVEKTNIEELHVKIEDVVNDLKKKFNPSTIFIPIEYYTDIETGNHVVRKDGQHLFETGGKRMKIIYSSNFVEFNDIIVLDKDASIWTYKPSKHAHNRLDITVKEHEKDKSLADVLVKTTLNLEVKSPEALKIIKIKRTKKSRK